ncbi:competence protein ComK [Lottiidibacillus patelloidae]|nr:competence protein ComK [Lottiidibacillus patelloidae]
MTYFNNLFNKSLEKKGRIDMAGGITTQTLYLEKVNHPDHLTKIKNANENEAVFSKNSWKKLMDEACIISGSTYEGRRKAIQKTFQYIQRTVIPVFPEHGVVAVPTHSPDNDENIWLFFHHVLNIIEIDKNSVEVIFSNGEKKRINVSYESLDKQLMRAARVANRFTPFSPPQPPYGGDFSFSV